MKIGEALKAAMNEAGIRQHVLAQMVGESSQSSVSASIGRDLRTSKLIKYANALGYEVVLVKKKPGKHPDGWIVIDGEGK